MVLNRNRAGASAQAMSRSIRATGLRRQARLAAFAACGGASLGFLGGWPVAAAGALSGAAGAALLSRDPGLRQQAARWSQGAEGERRTSRAAASLRHEGWSLSDDRSVPNSKANLDHLFVHPSGTLVILGDTKAWHAKGAKISYDPVNACLWYGPWDQNSKVNTIRWEASVVADHLDLTVISMLILDGATIDPVKHPEGWIRIDQSFYVVEQRHLAEILQSFPVGQPDKRRVRAVQSNINHIFPAYRRSAS